MPAKPHSIPQQLGQRGGGQVSRTAEDVADIEGSDLQHDPLNDTERKALLLLMEDMEPGAELRPLKEIAARCGITQRQLQRIRGKAQFQEEFRAMLLKRIDRMVPVVLAASFETAKHAGKEGFQDRKLLLEIAHMRGGAGAGRGNFGRGQDGQEDLPGQAFSLGEKLGRALNEAERRIADLANGPPPIDVTPVAKSEPEAES